MLGVHASCVCTDIDRRLGAIGRDGGPSFGLRLTQLLFQKERETEIDETFQDEAMPMLTLKGTRQRWPSHGCCDQAAGHVI
jgi:hypothetical protein